MNKQCYFVIFSSLMLALMLVLPSVLQPTIATSAPALQGNPPVDGQWTGTTNRGFPMSFDVSSGGTLWSNFKLKTDFSVGGCSGTLETTVFGPGTITNNQFSFSGSTFSFSGQFTSASTASGTYAFTSHFIPGCGNFNQSGTWTANTTAPPPTPTPSTPPPPSSLTAQAVSQMQILLNWKDNSTNETGFKIERSPNGASSWNQIATVGANIKTYINTGLDCGTTYYYRVRAYNLNGNSNYSNIANATTTACSYDVYLPIILKSFASPPGTPVPPTPTSGPKPGFWESSTADEFYVTSDSTQVDDFAIFITVTGCGSYKITRTTPVPITNNQFSFTGSFYASGTFNTTTTASGTDGLNNFNIPGCGLVSGGPWPWNATWKNSTQPTLLPATIVGPEIVEPITATTKSYPVTRVE